MSMELRDIGPPDYKKFMHPVLLKNYGKWKSHEHVKPGVIKHISETGDVVYTVRAGIPKFISTESVRFLCDLADKYCDGYLRFTTRHNVEFIVTKEENVDKLIKELEDAGYPVGGTGHSLKAIIHCVGYLHCNLAATDSPSIAKALYEALYDYFKRTDLPERIKIAVSGCLNMCGATNASDISIIGVHTKPPRVIDEVVHAQCSPMELVKLCPTYAIKPKRIKKNGKVITSVEIDPEKCMYCGNCYAACPGLPIHDPENDGVSIWVGGKASMTKQGIMESRLLVPFIPNHPPKWEKVVDIVKRIIDIYLKYAKPDERLGEMIERIGWEKFFELIDVPFTYQHIDDFIFAYKEYRKGISFRFTKHVK